LASSQ